MSRNTNALSAVFSYNAPAPAAPFPYNRPTSGINLVTIVFNNGAYGNVLRDQQRMFGGRVLGSELRNPDFVKLAESFGMAGRRVATPAQLKPALEQALSADAPALIDWKRERHALSAFMDRMPFSVPLGIPVGLPLGGAPGGPPQSCRGTPVCARQSR